MADMIVVVMISLLVSAASAVPQEPWNQNVVDAYGHELDYVIASETEYPAAWQRVHGDPHGQVAYEEFPSEFADNTLSWDFPKAEDGELDLVLYNHRWNGLMVIGTVTENRLKKVLIKHTDFEVEFFGMRIEITEGGVSTTEYYDTPFVEALPSWGTVEVTGDVLYNVDFHFGGYHFVVTKPMGIYNVSGETEFGMSITMLSGAISDMEGLMGQVTSYVIYFPPTPHHIGDTALAKSVLRDANYALIEESYFLTTLSHHVGMYKTCWHYEQGGDAIHAVVGNFTNFYYTP